MSYLRIIGAIIFAATIVIFGLVRISFEVIGASTAPDDFALLKHRMPKMLEWLFTTPWWVPTGLLIFMAGASAWLFVTGTRNAASKGIVGAGDNQITLEDVQSIIAKHLADLPTLKSKSNENAEAIKAWQFEDHKTAVIDSLERNSVAAKEVKNYAEATTATLSHLHSELKETVEKLVSYSEQTRREMHERIDWIGQAFAAIGHWDWHKSFYAKLVSDGDELCRLVDHPITDEIWAEWNNSEKHWRAELGQWFIFAEYYAPNTEASVNEINDHVYYNESWSFDESIFGKADRVRRYKELAIAVMNLKEVKGHVDRAMKHAAFEGVGKRGRQDSPPRLGGDR